MPESLPTFRYHPDPIASGAIEPADTVCVACERSRGYIYVGPVYALDELNEQICPWCIHDGTAHAKLDATFVDDCSLGAEEGWDPVPPKVVEVLTTRTPCFSGWQQERWFTCCGDGAAFLGRAGRSELSEAGPDAVKAIQDEVGYSGSPWDDYFAALDADGSPTAYLFQCLTCRRYGGYSDCD